MPDSKRFNQLLRNSQIIVFDDFTYCEVFWQVVIVTRKHLYEAIESYPDASNEIKAWVGIVEAVRWHNFAEVRGTFTDADYVNGYVIFDVRDNRYRLITVIHYAKTTKEIQTKGPRLHSVFFLTHKQYGNPSNWDRRFGTK